MAKTMPIRRKDFDVQGFLAFVARSGGEVGTPTNPYEVVRYRAYWRGTNTSSVHVVYAKENGLLTWTGGSEGHYRAFVAGTPMEELPGAEDWQLSRKNEEKLRTAAKEGGGKLAVSRRKLRARDGDDCWFCGTPLGDDCTIEHLIPKSKGGRNSLANYALAHQRCNADAADLPLVEKIALRTRLHAAQAGVTRMGGDLEQGSVAEGHSTRSDDSPMRPATGPILHPISKERKETHD